MKLKSPKLRIDQWLVEKQLVSSREKAQALIMAGKIYQGEQRIDKPSQLVLQDSENISIKGPDHPYVSRGGVKLEGALRDFNINARGKICLDIGASTGGFTDCLLQKGALKVYAFDCGSHQLHEKLRQDSRVLWRENFNVRHLQAEDIPEPIDLIVVDVSFISLRLIVPPLIEQLAKPFELLTLVKPQFEAGRAEIHKGIVRNPETHRFVIQEMTQFLQSLGLEVLGQNPSQLTGDKGNQEFFIFSKI